MAKRKLTIKKIRKRDGRIVPFNQEKITTAIWKAAEAVGGRDRERAKWLSNKVVEILENRFNGHTIATVEQIQDIVEMVLMRHGHYTTAKAYILYRDLHNKIRDIKSLIDSDELMGNYINGVDWRIKENSNMAYSLQGLNNYVASEISSRYWLNQLYPKEVRDAHNNGDLHLHNLQLLAPYCVGWDFQDLLIKGFTGVPGKASSRPARHLRTALGQLANFLYTMQGESAGANAISNFDTLLAPFVWADRLSYKEVKQAIQEFIFNLNVPTRVGFQAPFTNITLDLTVPRTFADEAAIIGGRPLDKQYKDFQKEMNMINQAFAEVMLEGDAQGRVFTWPIPTYNITRDFEWENDVLEPIWEMTAKYGVPYFSNFVNSDMKPEDARSMCLDSKEEILIRNSKKIKRLLIKEAVERYKAKDFDKEGWVECKKEGSPEALSLNPETFKTEWTPIKRFLRIFSREMVEITTKDGKRAVFSAKHPIPVFTRSGIQMKWAGDIKKGDYLFSLKKATSSLSDEYQKIDNFVLDEDLARILGYFIAEGNYLFESRKGYTHYGKPRGLQFTFRTGDEENLEIIRSLIKKVFNLTPKEKQDPRYSTYYLYVYNSQLARKLYNAGFKKYGRLPQILFSSPPDVIRNFLEFHFKGDGHEKRKEVHMGDLELSRDLVLLYSLIGQPVTYKLRKKSQRIYLQHSKSRIKKGSGWLTNPLLAERVPGFLAASTYKVPGLKKSRMVGLATLGKYGAHTEDSLKIKNGDIYIIQVKDIRKKTLRRAREFYDIELEKNHLFLHSLGQISFNCCRLRLDKRELKKRGGGYFGSNPLTGSIGVVTLNMARIGYLAKNEKDYFKKLEYLMKVARDSLLTKRQILERFTERGLYPYSRFYLSGIKQRFGGYWRNHFNTIGVHGMNESLLNFLGVDIGSRRGRKFALRTLDFMREKLGEYQEETNELFNLEATPAEGATYRFATLDKKLYPKIIVANEKDVQENGGEPYYTNSTHLPVGYTDDLFEALELQDELQTKYTGGTVFHCFLGEALQNGEMAKLLVRRIAENYRLPYYTLTPSFSVCRSHGYLKGEHKTCPECGRRTEIFSRVVGYLRPVQQWNPGKQAEFWDRKGFKVQ